MWSGRNEVESGRSVPVGGASTSSCGSQKPGIGLTEQIWHRQVDGRKCCRLSSTDNRRHIITLKLSSFASY